jgi:hypothetical protein
VRRQHGVRIEARNGRRLGVTENVYDDAHRHALSKQE